jgi:hypothetical protein
MTIGVAWVGKRRDGREHLFFASDSRVTGGQRLDACPKLFTLPRSDCALCFAGHTAASYPFMIQVAYAIAAHEPARERSLDIAHVKSHILRVFTDLTENIKEAVLPPSKSDVQFLFGGYSWVAKEFRIWTIHYLEKEKRFAAREAITFHSKLAKAAFIGDWAKAFRGQLVRSLNVMESSGTPVYLEPLLLLADALKAARTTDTIGGPPQLVRVTQHMNTRPICVRWNGEDTLFGRQLFEYENTDYWIIDPFSGKFMRPRKFGRRDVSVETDEIADT